jgi:hypothetical protein
VRRWTYSEIKEKIQKDLDLEDEDFIQEEELLGYVNEGIDACESLIHTLYEDYFLTSASLTLVNGTASYALPSDIFANKIRAVDYINGSTIAPVRRIKEQSRYQDIALSNANPGGAGNYRYLLTNPTAGPRIQFVPAAQESGAYITLWYIRNAARLVDDTDECDIPEFTSFVIQFAKVRCLEKEGNPMVQKAIADLANYQKLMVETLSTMVPDGDNTVEMDTSFYEEMS